MQALNVEVYFDYDFSQSEKFYNFYQCSAEKIDLADFLDNIIDSDTNYNKIYGIVNGERVFEYSVILTFYNSDNDKKYMIFTDGTIDEFGKNVIYALTYDEDKPEPFKEFIVDNLEWQYIESIMNSIFINKH